jgi:hypothetical protein
MWNLRTNELLSAWELGLGRGMAERAVILLRAAAGEDMAGRDPALLPLGVRDGLLLDLYKSAFGPRIEGVASCPECRAEQEFHLCVEDLKIPATSDGASQWTITCGAYQVAFRLPDSLDAEAIASDAAGTGDRAAAARCLLERCVITATALQQARQQSVTASELPDDVVQAISARMSELDPQAEIELMMECVACRHRWPELLDVATFLWGEIHAWAVRTLGDVHQLAASYGWSEADVLAMSPRRRSLYIELITS